MRGSKIVILVCSCLQSLGQQELVHQLMPIPTSIIIGPGHLEVGADFRISVIGDPKDSILYAAAERLYFSMGRRTGLFFRQQHIVPADSSAKASLVIQVIHRAAVSIGEDESYHLEVSSQRAMLKANTTIGALRGMETILQLLGFGPLGAFMPACAIEDAPQLAWRGLMVDVSRHFMPLDLLERNIDAMSQVKMNILHLHLSDDQGFRVESKLFPGLTAKGSNGQFYTQTQIRELVKYAQSRGIMIIPEFDMPSHARSWFAAYPELASAPGPYEPGQAIKLSRGEQDTFSIQKAMQDFQTTPTATFDPSREEVYHFLDQFIGEMATLFPAPYFHIGADENNGVAWQRNPSIQAFMKDKKIQNTHELQAYFVGRIVQILKKHHKEAVGWEELFTKNLSKEVMVQVWNPMNALGLAEKVIEAGNPVILSKGLYLDYFMPAYIHYQLTFPNKITGAEAAIWTELCTSENLEPRVWPRVAAIAERCWSVAQETDLEAFYSRLFRIGDLLDGQGLQQIDQYQKMTRRFARGQDLGAVENLLDLLSPVKGFKRVIGLYTLDAAASLPFAPLNRAADIALVDSRVKWAFRKSVQRFLSDKDPESEKIIREKLVQWRDNHARLKGFFAISAQGREVETHSLHLHFLAIAALERMDQGSLDSIATLRWVESKANLLKESKAEVGEVELNVESELEALIVGKLADLPKQYSIF